MKPFISSIHGSYQAVCQEWVRRQLTYMQRCPRGCPTQSHGGKMQAWRHNQVVGIVYRNIWTKYGLQAPKSQWETPLKLVENNRAKMLWDFRFQPDKQLLADQAYMVVDKEPKNSGSVVVYSRCGNPADQTRSIRRREQLEQTQHIHILCNTHYPSIVTLHGLYIASYSRSVRCYQQKHPNCDQNKNLQKAVSFLEFSHSYHPSGFSKPSYN